MELSEDQRAGLAARLLHGEGACSLQVVLRRGQPELRVDGEPMREDGTFDEEAGD